LLYLHDDCGYPYESVTRVSVCWSTGCLNHEIRFDYASWKTGFGDFHMDPDLDTLTPCAWNPGTAVVLCDLRNVNTHELVPIAPRSILRKQIERFETLQQVGQVYMASELEHYLYEDTFREAHDKNYSNLTSSGYYSEDYHILQGHRTEPFHKAARTALRQSGIPSENSKGETGIGQHELNVRYAEALQMADRHVLFKMCLKEVAEDQKKSVTFMAKPFHQDAGSSCHIHLSPWSKAGDENLFVGNEVLESIENCSPLFKNFLAGWIKHTPDLMAFYAPTVNSYKRYSSASWAPTATAWGRDNRTTGFRIVGSGKSLRIEFRIPGADVNPYLAFAASIASGLDGIQNNLTPPPMFEGDAYAASAESARISTTLGEASSVFTKSDFVRDNFGDDVQKHYGHFYQLEQNAFDKAVTDWERQRYFEQI